MSNVVFVGSGLAVTFEMLITMLFPARPGEAALMIAAGFGEGTGAGVIMPCAWAYFKRASAGGALRTARQAEFTASFPLASKLSAVRGIETSLPPESVNSSGPLPVGAKPAIFTLLRLKRIRAALQERRLGTPTSWPLSHVKGHA